ncbi:hypothetical protein Hanom_Chr06g00526111 [Helianthus anomalus]
MFADDILWCMNVWSLGRLRNEDDVVAWPSSRFLGKLKMNSQMLFKT